MSFIPKHSKLCVCTDGEEDVGGEGKVEEAEVKEGQEEGEQEDEKDPEEGKRRRTRMLCSAALSYNCFQKKKKTTLFFFESFEVTNLRSLILTSLPRIREIYPFRNRGRKVSPPSFPLLFLPDFILLYQFRIPSVYLSH